jgi:hypothetical protein
MSDILAQSARCGVSEKHRQGQRRLGQIEKDIRKKRALKRKAAWLRRQADRPLHAPPQSPETIPIRIVDEDPHLLYSSSEFRNHENAVSRTRIRRFATIRAYR